ncbi:hypothetical protein BRC91_11760 [Halobacteriales archaeon QS_4_62_28]|nr:MAG: hypothetical protein BRC91_11760 [Halobacteriales archaeon QS_4_62_28]
MKQGLSRRKYLLFLGSTTPLAGCPAADQTKAESADPRRGKNTTTTPADETTITQTSTSTTDWDWEGAPEPTVIVSNEGNTDYETFEAAYNDSNPGDVIGIGRGEYSLDQLKTKSLNSVDVNYDTVDKSAITVVGHSRSNSKLTFDTESSILSVPDWEFWNLTTETNGSVIGPRDGKHRESHVKSPIMDPPGYASGTDEVDGTTLSKSGLAHTVSAERTRYGIAFDRVVDAVDDLGVDNTGTEPIDAALDTALQSGTLIEFPPGEYLLEESHKVAGMDRVGIRGTGSSRRDVRLYPSEGVAIKPIDAGLGTGAVLIENMVFDELEDDETQVSLLVRTSGGTVVKNIEFLGRTPDDNSGRFSYTVGAEVTDVDGLAVFENIHVGLDTPAKPVEYPDGVEFIWGGPEHVGEVVLRNPIVHRRNSNGVRYTDGSGVLTLIGGEFVNNQNANVRFGAGNHPSKVSSATGTYIKVDQNVVTTSDALRVSGDGDDAGAIFRGINIDWGDVNGRGAITFPSFDPHGRAEFYNCVVHNVRPDTPTVWATPVSIEDDPIVFENCSFTGTGGGFIANSRPGSVIRNSCIDMPDASIRGFATENISSADCQLPAKSHLWPSATITAVKKDGRTVELSAVDSVDPDREITSHQWMINGTTHTGETISHTFELPGTYTVDLTVTNRAGDTATANSQLVVDYPSLIRNSRG